MLSYSPDFWIFIIALILGTVGIYLMVPLWLARVGQILTSIAIIILVYSTYRETKNDDWKTVITGITVRIVTTLVFAFFILVSTGWLIHVVP